MKLYKELNDLDFDRSVDLNKLEEVPRDDGSIIFVKERQRKWKLALLCKRRKGNSTGETEQMLTFTPEDKETDCFVKKISGKRWQKNPEKGKTENKRHRDVPSTMHSKRSRETERGNGTSFHRPRERRSGERQKPLEKDKLHEAVGTGEHPTDMDYPSIFVE